MREIRKKQKKLYKAMRILLYAAIAVLVVYRCGAVGSKGQSRGCTGDELCV